VQHWPLWTRVIPRPACCWLAILQSHALINGMQLLLAEARRILAAKKELFDLHSWEAAENRGGCSISDIFRARVALDGGAFRGLWFRASKFRDNTIPGRFSSTWNNRT
jgi:hypothetical protein